MVEKAGQGSGLAPFDGHRLSMEVLRIAYSVEAGYTGDHNHVPSSGHQSRGGAKAQLVDLVVDAEIFLYVGVGGRKIGFRLVIVVIGYKILHSIGREEALEFSVQLGCESLVVAQDQGGTLELLDDIRHRECLA